MRLDSASIIATRYDTSMHTTLLARGPGFVLRQMQLFPLEIVPPEKPHLGSSYSWCLLRRSIWGRRAPEQGFDVRVCRPLSVTYCCSDSIRQFISLSFSSHFQTNSFRFGLLRVLHCHTKGLKIYLQRHLPHYEGSSNFFGGRSAYSPFYENQLICTLLLCEKLQIVGRLLFFWPPRFRSVVEPLDG